VPFKELSADRPGTSSADLRAQVTSARGIQAERFEGTQVRYNAKMRSPHIRKFCPLSQGCQNLMRDSVNELGLSARAHDKVLRVARTIADLERCDDIEVPHIQEAVNYRMLDRQLWK